jgi:di/tricarboxylate transporter
MTIIGSNLAFATPVSTPPITMTLVAGYRFMDYMKVGGLFNLLTVIFASFTIPFIYGIA